VKKGGEGNPAPALFLNTEKKKKSAARRSVDGGRVLEEVYEEKKKIWQEADSRST